LSDRKLLARLRYDFAYKRADLDTCVGDVVGRRRSLNGSDMPFSDMPLLIRFGVEHGLFGRCREFWVSLGIG
jgi:hypothetical protein